MPTPFTHLALAPALLGPLPLPVRAALEAQWPAFLLGNIAPDVQSLSGQPREATHFFTIPLGPTPPAPALFAAHPQLARTHTTPAQAAFLAGYLAHLTLDVGWITEIFQPFFLDGHGWADRRDRSFVHNVLRAHVDVEDRAALSDDTGSLLTAAEPDHWLPFETDTYLRGWRDFVAEQLHPGAPSRTLEVFASRVGYDPEAFAAVLASPSEMQRRVFSRVGRDRLQHYRDLSVARAAAMIEQYWG